MSQAILDLFAGSGVGVAAHRVGLEDFGVEIMPEARQTRLRNGMKTVYADAWDTREADGLDFNHLWASPPCPTFSVAGKGAGRRALNEVITILRSRSWQYPANMRLWANGLDDARTGLVLLPMSYIWRFRPTYIALEQVPSVLPVWDAMTGALDELGYSTWSGLLRAEQFGVPQTRRRAFLIARNDGSIAHPPAPTHSRFHTRRPERLDGGVKKWVSIAEALGVPEDRLLGFPRRDDGKGAIMIAGKAYRARDLRPTSQPAFNLTEKARSWTMYEKGEAGANPIHRLGVQAAATLQGFPPGFTFSGERTKQFLQVGNAVPPPLAEAVLRTFEKKNGEQ